MELEVEPELKPAVVAKATRVMNWEERRGERGGEISWRE